MMAVRFSGSRVTAGVVVWLETFCVGARSRSRSNDDDNDRL